MQGGGAVSFATGFVVTFLAFLGVVAAGLAIARALKSRALARPPAPIPSAAPHPGPRARPLPDAPVERARAAPSSAAGFGKDEPMEAALRSKIRDRYIAARFAGIAKCSGDLRNFERTIKAARLFFEEDRGERALELLALAIEEDPACEPTRLARLELAFLLHDAALFGEGARELRQLNPQSPAWGEVARLGRILAPDVALFGPPQGPSVHEHYGAWPEMPNWLHASWDLTAEVRATDFHRAVMASPPTGVVGAGH